MKKTLIVASAALLMGTLPVFTAPAEAGLDWIFGTGFHIGDVYFQIGYRDYDHDYGSPAYYYRTRVDLGRTYYGRPHHHEGCYYSGGYYYHGQSCPLVQAYLSRHGHRHYDVFVRYAPGYGRHNYAGPGYYGHRDSYRYERDRHHRYDRHDYDHRYYDRHRHYRDGHHRDHGRCRDHRHDRGHGYGRGHRH